MPPLGYHVMCRLADGRVIAPTPEARRTVACSVLEREGKHQLLAFKLADTHLHLEICEDERASSELARRIEISVTKRLRLPVGFAPAFPRPILDQRHLFNVFDYIMRQSARHGLEGWDPLHEASNLPDLLGLRVLGASTARTVRKLLPRVDRALLLRYLQLEKLEPRSEPAEHLVPAALAATGLHTLQGNTETAHRARRALVEVIGARWPATRIAALLGTNRRTVQRLRSVPADGALVRAIELQVGLRVATQELQRARQARPQPPLPVAGPRAAAHPVRWPSSAP